MNTEGDPSLWADVFDDDLLPAILDLVIESWKSFPKPSPYDHEVPITRRFCVHLRSCRRRAEHRFRIDCEPEILSSIGKVVGRIDLQVSHGWEESAYFSLECKRLNTPDGKGRWLSLAGEYVEEGMLRYIKGQYRGGDNGGMIAYIMNGDLNKALQNVSKAITDRAGVLVAAGNLQLGRSSIRPACAHTRESRHVVRNRVFTIHHLFLPVN